MVLDLAISTCSRLACPFFLSLTLWLSSTLGSSHHSFYPPIKSEPDTHSAVCPFLLQPVSEISRRIKALNQIRAASGLPRVLVHTDAAQALGKRRVDVEDLGVDFLTIVGHKVCAHGLPSLHINLTATAEWCPQHRCP